MLLALPAAHVGQHIGVDRVSQVVEFVHRQAVSVHGDHKAAFHQPGELPPAKASAL